MKTIVITGSTRGIGFGLADEFLKRGCRVMISGRRAEVVQNAAADLAKKHGADRIAGHPCDVTDYEQVQALWDAAKERFGQVDIWLNNAGSANTLIAFWDLPVEKMQEVIQTNLIGTMHGIKVAMREMIKQGHGALYNMEGFGSRGGRKLPGLTLYGTSKAATAYLTDALIEETKGLPVIVGSISPGMVVTDMLLNQRSGSAEDWERSKRAFNILADKVETVTPWLVEKMLANDKHGTRIRWLTGTKIMGRFISAPFTRRKVID